MSEKRILDFMERINDDFCLYEKDFLGVTFTDFSLRPSAGHQMELSNVKFDNCAVSNGTCVIRKGVSLKNVTFKDFECGDALHISAEVFLENVKIVGLKKPAMLWVRAQEDDGESKRDKNDLLIALDITDYEGEVSITGLPSSKVALNPDCHVVVRADWLEQVDWKGKGFSPLSYWKLMAKKVVADKSMEGIFSIPSKTGKNYERSMMELGILKKDGFIV